MSERLKGASGEIGAKKAAALPQPPEKGVELRSA
jgi:hypothetical protein